MLVEEFRKLIEDDIYDEDGRPPEEEMEIGHLDDRARTSELTPLGSPKDEEDEGCVFFLGLGQHKDRRKVKSKYNEITDIVNA